MARFEKRLQKELQALKRDSGPHLSLRDPDDLRVWYVDVIGAENTLYQGERFVLRFRFPPNYPLEAPEVVFVQQIPLHEHIYSNGHICLSTLYDDWSPALSVRSVCLSVLSMLSSAKAKKSPPDNDVYTRTVGTKSPKETRWWYHDNKA